MLRALMALAVTLVTATLIVGWLELTREPEVEIVEFTPPSEEEKEADAFEGPHSISLYDHARAGDAERVMEYLESKGLKRDDPFEMDRADAEQYFGQYAWGPGETERFEVDWFERRSALSLARAGQTTRNLIPLGGHRFSPAGARHIVIRFDVSGPSARLFVPRPAAPELVATRT